MSVRALSLLATSALLAACGGGDALLEMNHQSVRAGHAADLYSEISAFPGTAYTAMPTSGSATFQGYAVIGIDPVPGPQGDDLAILGDLELTAEFDGRGRVTGVADNMSAQTGSSGQSAVEGSIHIGARDSQIGHDAGAPDRLLRPNEWVADYGGTLDVDGSRYTLAGELDGQFHGTQVGQDSVIRGVTGADSGTTSTGGTYGISVFAQD